MGLDVLALAIIYAVVVLGQDITATVRKETPERAKAAAARRERRAKMLEAREKRGEPVPRGSARAYLTGVWDDAWASAWDKRAQMADVRNAQRQRRIDAKIDRATAKLRAHDEARDAAGRPTGGDSVRPIRVDPHRRGAGGFDAKVPAAPPRDGGGTGPTDTTAVTWLNVDSTPPRRGAAGNGAAAPGNPPPGDGAGTKASEVRGRAADGGSSPKGRGDATTMSSPAGPPEPWRGADTREGWQEAVCVYPVTGGPGEPAEPCGRTFSYFGKPGNRAGLICSVHPFAPRETDSDDGRKKTSTPTTSRTELPTVSNEISGLESAIQYAQVLRTYCTTMHEEVAQRVPSAQSTAQSCESARSQLAANGVGGRPLEDVGHVQEQMTAAVTALQDALAGVDQAAAAAARLEAELIRHRAVAEAYAANRDAGSREFVRGE